MSKILAVDDSPAIRCMIETVLKAQGHEVFLAEDGQEGLNFARKQSVDLVITDLNMPNIGGISLVSKLRRITPYSKIPILVMTTETSDYKKDKARHMGANGWIAKPVTEERLVGAVEKVLKH